MCEFLQAFGTAICKSGRHRGQIMDAAIERRVSVATCWATTRIAFLDTKERYEDSYAITQEFCEWITCDDDHSELLKRSILTVPSNHSYLDDDKTRGIDEPLEI